MKLNDFQNFALSTKEQNNINGGGWSELRGSLKSYYGTAVDNYSAEVITQFNPFTGSMEESNYIQFDIEFAGNQGESFQIAKDDYDLCLARLQSIFKF